MAEPRAALLARLVGAPYADRARGPDRFDCWGLFAYARPRLGHRDAVPFIDADPGDLRAVARAFADPVHATGWREHISSGAPFQAPDGAALLLTRGDIPHHIGLWLAPERLVLHCCAAQNTVCESLAHLRAAHWRIARILVPDRPSDP